MPQQAVSNKKVKFATQLAPELLDILRGMATREGRHLQTILDEAVREYIENRKADKPRRHVLTALQDSMLEHDNLYKVLAK